MTAASDSFPHRDAPAEGATDGAGVALVASAMLPTRHGEFKVHAFVDGRDGKEHLAIVRGEVFGGEDVPTRIHSECLTGDVLGSLRCDCQAQLELALQKTASVSSGIVLYLRQEGRGIGLVNKIRAYRLQEQGLDTVDANLALGFRDDERDYRVAVSMLRTLGVRSVDLMTNNPDKLRQLERYGMRVSHRVPHVIAPGDHNRAYLRTKATRAGHLLPVGDERGVEA
jgi:GTP cyclohydrolase II